MTNPQNESVSNEDSTSAATGSNVTSSLDATVVTMDRVKAVMSGFGVELAGTDHPHIATANLNGISVTFAQVGGAAMIVRADVTSDEAVEDGNPAQFLACNHFNAYTADVKAVIVDRTEKIIRRMERDISIAAGLTDAQLKDEIRFAVDHVLAGQEALQQLVESVQAETAKTSSKAPESDG